MNAPTKRTPPLPAVAVILEPVAELAGHGWLTITADGKTDHYLFREVLLPEPGRHFEMTKSRSAQEAAHLGRRADPYHVQLLGDQGTCDCRAGLRRGHCRHLTAAVVIAHCGPS